VHVVATEEETATQAVMMILSKVPLLIAQQIKFHLAGRKSTYKDD